MSNRSRRVLWPTLVAVGAFISAGCGDAGGTAKIHVKAKAASAEAKEGKKSDDHSGWWCDEHGVPESECSMCSAKAAKAFKAKGDWCDKHDRAKSQCFICDPSLEAKYAVRYEAKFGKQPPVPEDNRAKKDE